MKQSQQPEEYLLLELTLHMAATTMVSEARSPAKKNIPVVP
ncbi:hypothetical protein OIU77_006960 [Salix suchowensis]|uniref:Uncharacterized protein n=1 Tax=Salix suchowensis TaxID=1278906 RepID=A0ABQ9ANX2_9ROSI|nr:hypothetical protein OIU77_006960 [Salix suchowensis]